MDRHFNSAILKLTGWYMLIVALVCIGFSLIIFGLSSAEFDRRLPRDPNAAPGQQIDPGILEDIRAERAMQSRSRLAANLIVLNACALALGGAGSYGLARRTLRPIRVATRSQGRFISDASHELRTPLAVMQSEIEVTLRGTPDKAALTRLARSNLEEVNRLRELSDRLLQLSSGAALPLSTVVVEDAVVEAVTPYFKRADERRITIINKTDASVALANADSLKDVISILLDNALKYSPEGSRVTVASTTRGRSVYVSVADRGRGIDARDLPFVFDRFYRADLSRTNGGAGDNASGHGLGLSIAKQITDLMRGDIDVVSTLGKGTTFTIKLDAAKK